MSKARTGNALLELIRPDGCLMMIIIVTVLSRDPFVFDKNQ